MGTREPSPESCCLLGAGQTHWSVGKAVTRQHAARRGGRFCHCPSARAALTIGTKLLACDRGDVRCPRPMALYGQVTVRGAYWDELITEKQTQFNFLFLTKRSTVLRQEGRARGLDEGRTGWRGDRPPPHASAVVASRLRSRSRALAQTCSPETAAAPWGSPRAQRVSASPGLPCRLLNPQKPRVGARAPQKWGGPPTHAPPAPVAPKDPCSPTHCGEGSAEEAGCICWGSVLGSG